MLRKRETGSATSPVLLGYVIQRDGEKSEVEVDPVAGPLVKEAFELAATGRSLREIMRQMNAEGLVGSRGGKLALSTLQEILRNHSMLRLLTS